MSQHESRNTLYWPSPRWWRPAQLGLACRWAATISSPFTRNPLRPSGRRGIPIPRADKPALRRRRCSPPRPQQPGSHSEVNPRTNGPTSHRRSGHEHRTGLMLEDSFLRCGGRWLCSAHTATQPATRDGVRSEVGSGPAHKYEHAKVPMSPVWKMAKKRLSR